MYPRLLLYRRVMTRSNNTSDGHQSTETQGVEPDCGGGAVLIDTEWLPRNRCCQDCVSTKSVPLPTFA